MYSGPNLKLSFENRKLWDNFRGQKFSFSYFAMPYGTQCGNFMTILSLRFYMESILENVEVLKVPFITILGAINCKMW